MKKAIVTILLLATAVVTPVLACAGADDARHFGSIEISHYWIRATEPGDRASMGYLVIRNNGDSMDCLIAAATPFAMWTELHRRLDNPDSMVSLRDGIDIPPGSSVVFEPGSHHLMFMDVDTPFRTGEMAEVSLTFERQGRISLDFPIVSMPEEL